MRSRIFVFPLLLSINLTFFLAWLPGSAQPPDSTAATSSLESILNPDGTLNLDRPFSGSIDPARWRMVLERDGTPRFVPMAAMVTDSTADSTGSVDGDQWWDTRFGHPGPTGIVYAIAVDSTGVYVGGRFLTAGKLKANSIVRWSMQTRRWTTLGEGVTGIVRALALDGDNLYVGGVIRTAGNLTVNGIARWSISGREWFAMGGGVLRIIDSVPPPYVRSGDVFALAVHGGNLYVGGHFYVADIKSVSNLARWNGSQWLPVGAGPDGDVFALAILRDTLYAGGGFYKMGTRVVGRIARYPIAGGAWTTMGGTDDTVRALAVVGNQLYVGGQFRTVGGKPARGLASWTGSAWQPVGSGVDGDVLSFTVDGNELYVGGKFHNAAGRPVNCIAKWNGGSWSALGIGMGLSESGMTEWSPPYIGDSISGFPYERDFEIGSTTEPFVWAIGVTGGSVFAGGHFTSAGGTTVHHLAEWSGSSWHEVDDDTTASNNHNGVDGSVFAVAFDGRNLYVGGDFSSAGNHPAHRVARWSLADREWYPLGDGIDSEASFVRALLVHGNDLFVGGIFSSAGGVPSPGIVRWDGSRWRSVGGGVGGVNPYVFALASDSNYLYAGGTFSLAGGGVAGAIARWSLAIDGWSSLGGDVDNSTRSGYVRALAIRGDELFVGGSFSAVGDIDAANIAVWRRGQWRALGSPGFNGVDGPVRALAIAGDTVYAGGDFLHASGHPAPYIAQWNGAAWAAVGRGANAPVDCILSTGTDLVLGGEFTSFDSLPVRHIARWSPAGTRPVGPAWKDGVEGFVHALAAGTDAVYAGGEFSHAGDLYTRFILQIPRSSVSSVSSIGSDSRDGLYQTIGRTQAYLTPVTVTNVAVHGTDVYASGNFVAAGGLLTGSLARWDGEQWRAILPPGADFNGIVRAMAFDGDGDLYVGGEFTKLGELPVHGIARWNGREWSSLGSGLAGSKPFVYSIAVSGVSIYAAGAFSYAGGAQAARVAVWDKSTGKWSGLGSGIDTTNPNRFVQSVVTYGNHVYIASLYSAFSTTIMDYDGVGWKSLAQNINGGVYTLGVDAGGQLYAGGDFTLTDGSSYARFLARWDGTQWNNFGPGLLGTIYTLAIGDSDLYIGGTFPWAANSNTPGLARFDGTRWWSMGRGVSVGYSRLPVGVVRTLAVSGRDVYVGGTFTASGGTPAYAFAHWIKPLLPPPLTVDKAPDVIARGTATVGAFPNPFRGSAKIDFILPGADVVTVDIFNIRGQRIEHLFEGNASAGPHSLRWEPRGIPDGTYFCNIRGGIYSATQSVTLLGSR